MSKAKSLGPTESQIQQALMAWWRMQHRSLGVKAEHLLMAFPMQGGRSPRNGARMKAEGMRKGLPDMFLAVPKRGMSGLWIELKRPSGRASPEQVAFLEDLNRAGYCTFICYGFDQAKSAITNYLNTPTQ